MGGERTRKETSLGHDARMGRRQGDPDRASPQPQGERVGSEEGRENAGRMVLSNWWMGNLEPQGIGRWAEIRGRGHKGLVGTRNDTKFASHGKGEIDT